MSEQQSKKQCLALETIPAILMRIESVESTLKDLNGFQREALEAARNQPREELNGLSFAAVIDAKKAELSKLRLEAFSRAHAPDQMVLPLW